MILKIGINNEAWFQVMNIFPLLSLLEEVNLGADRSSGNLGQFCLAIISESTKLFDVHASSGSNIVANVFNKGFPNDK